MGNAQQGSENITSTSSKKVQIQDYVFEKTSDEDRFGVPIKVYRHKTQDTYVAAKSRPIDDKEQAKQLEVECTRRGQPGKIFHRNLSKIYGYSTAEAPAHWCGSAMQFTIYFEYAKYDLATEIQERARFGDRFKEQDLHQLIKDISGACLHLKQFSLTHPDISPSTILCTSTRDFVLIDSLLLEERSSLTQLILGLKKEFVSPAILASTREKQYEVDHNQEKSDVFSLGMTALSAATLCPVTKCYNWSTYTINEEAVKELLIIAAQKYSPGLVRIIQTMVEIDEATRPTFDKLGQTGPPQPHLGYPHPPAPYPMPQQSMMDPNQAPKPGYPMQQNQPRAPIQQIPQKQPYPQGYPQQQIPGNQSMMPQSYYAVQQAKPISQAPLPQATNLPPATQMQQTTSPSTIQGAPPYPMAKPTGPTAAPPPYPYYQMPGTQTTTVAANKVIAAKTPPPHAPNPQPGISTPVQPS